MSKKPTTNRITNYEVVGVINDKAVKEFLPGNWAKSFTVVTKKDAFNLYNRLDPSTFRSITRVVITKTCLANHLHVFDPYNEKDEKRQEKLNSKIQMKEKLYSMLAEIEELKLKLEKI